MLREFKETTGPIRNIKVSMIGFQGRMGISDSILYAEYSTKEIQERLSPDAFSIRTASCPRPTPPNRPIRPEPIPTCDHSRLHRFPGTGRNRLRCWPRRSLQHTYRRQRSPFQSPR
jgi:hypothetical protein